MNRRHFIITAIFLTAFGGLFAVLLFNWPAVRSLAALGSIPPVKVAITATGTEESKSKELKIDEPKAEEARTVEPKKPASKSFAELTPVLMYHYIEAPTASTTLPGLYLRPEIFKDQLQEIKKNGYTPIFLADLAASLRDKKKLPSRSIVLTFDDGYEDFYTQAYPLLKEYGFKSTLYVIVNRLDTSGYLTKAQVKELAESGLVEIGSHTFNHPDLRLAKEKAAEFEIKDSRLELEKISGRPVLTFAYPFGHYQVSDLAIASSSSYQGAVSVQPGVWQSTEDIWLIRRLRPGAREGKEFSKWLEDWLK